VTSPTIECRACIHLGEHKHPVADGICRETINLVYQCVAKEVSRTPNATNSAIMIGASRVFLENFLFKSPTPGEKRPSLESVMDKYEALASPNCRNYIVGAKRLLRSDRGPIDSIQALKVNNPFIFVHENRFPGQTKDKVFIFKMSVQLEGSGFDLVKRMQHGGDLQDSWVMFDHVKRLNDWTTMGCHVYDSTYCKVMTIACCDMQSEDASAQILFWQNLNSVMHEHGVSSINFKGFMADSAQANWIAVRKVYGGGDENTPMKDKERTCLYHWSVNLDKYTQKYIKPSMQAHHKQLCQAYKNAKSLEEAETQFHVIKNWWLSSGAATEDGVTHLQEWFGFWHFRYKQWGGEFQMVSLVYQLIMKL
jgi:hypothetical protein